MRLDILLILVLRLISCAESAVEVKNIETQAGYAVLQGEPIDLISGFSELIHVIDIQDIGDTIHRLKTSVSHSFIVKDGWLILNLDKKIKELEHLLQTLKIHTKVRYRRALIDVGGRVINWLFGNMDDEDRLRIENHFKTVDFNQKNIIDNMNKQVKINNEMQSYLQNIRLVVEQNKNWFNKTYTGAIEENLRITKYNNFVLLINEIRNKIEQIQENIVMSKYGITSRFFLTNDEIDHFDINGLKLKYMRSSMGSMGDRLIVFVLMIPEFVEKEYRTEIVVPIPAQNYMQLNIEITKTVTIENITYLIEEENVLHKMKVVDPCLSNVLKNNYRECSKIKKTEKSAIEFEIGNLLLTNVNATLFDACTNFSYPLKGNYIVNFKDCEIDIDGFRIKRFESKLNIIIPNFNVLPSNITEKLPKINFTNINEIEQTFVKMQNNHNFYILYALFFIFISYYILSKIKDCNLIRRVSNLNGGRVICTNPTDDEINQPMSIHL